MTSLARTFTLEECRHFRRSFSLKRRKRSAIGELRTSPGRAKARENIEVNTDLKSE
jgi:hypothetical protein